MKNDVKSELNPEVVVSHFLKKISVLRLPTYIQVPQKSPAHGGASTGMR